ncbi:MAG TPA: YceI family protein [Cyclobacteriaceae bacterium]|nr:YceI family protein [Cyclobacteriaceae bacterium]
MKRTVFFVLITLIIGDLNAQVRYGINPESVLSIQGTSNIHDWTSKANTINGEFSLMKAAGDRNLPKNGKLVDKLRLEVPVKSIESGRGPVMDGKTYDALKSEEFPNIIFVVKENNITGITDNATGKFGLSVTGDLTIAGSTKPVTINVSSQRIQGNSFRFEGSYSLNMTEYDIEPPTALFGQITTGEEVTIVFNILIDVMK